MRIKLSVPRHARKTKLLRAASGYYGDKSRRLRMATQQLGKSWVHSYVDRRDKKHNYRQLWITRINAAARLNGMSYSVLMDGLKKKNIQINRKMLADIAVNDPAAFTKLVETVRG